MQLRRSGYTLLELLVVVAIGGLVLGLGALLGFRHQRFHRDVVIAVERSDELGELVALMPVSLRDIAPSEGDIAPGGARDTALEFRATIASAALCDSGFTNVVLAPKADSPALTSVLSRPDAGDTAWLLDATGANEVWTPRSITAVFDSSAICRMGPSAPFGIAPRVSMALRLSAAAPPGVSVVRITRPWRYSLYKASDGAWYLGAKEWNASQSRFNAIQPVAGPLVSAALAGIRFRYYDSTGVLLPAVPPDPGRIAAIEVGFRVDSVIPGKYAHAASVRSRASLMIALPNRSR